MNYEKQANDFLVKNDVSFKATRKKDKLMKDWDNEYHACYRITLKKPSEHISFDFHASIAEPNKCNSYDVLASITKYDPENFENFCSDFGYEKNWKNKRIYNKVLNEWERISKFFTLNELVELREIA